MSLTTLPLLPLEKIASYLDFSSLVSLAASTSSLAHLQPKEQLVKGEDFSVAGVGFRPNRSRPPHGRPYGPRPEPHYVDVEYYYDVDVDVETLSVAGFDPHGRPSSPKPKPKRHEPEPYFDVEVKTRGLLGIKMVWEWEGTVSRAELINVIC